MMVTPSSSCRLRADGLQVIERTRPRQQPASLGVNHGGVVVKGCLHYDTCTPYMYAVQVYGVHVS